MKRLFIFMISSLVVFSFCFLSLPSSTMAITGVGFGGYVTAVIPCTCSGGAIITYSKLFVNNPVPIIGSLWFQIPLSIPFSFYNIGIPTTWEVGRFTPGVQAACLVGIPPVCVPVTMPVLGLIQYVGTSLPLSKPF